MLGHKAMKNVPNSDLAWKDSKRITTDYHFILAGLSGYRPDFLQLAPHYCENIIKTICPSLHRL